MLSWHWERKIRKSQRRTPRHKVSQGKNLNRQFRKGFLRLKGANSQSKKMAYSLQTPPAWSTFHTKKRSSQIWSNQKRERCLQHIAVPWCSLKNALVDLWNSSVRSPIIKARYGFPIVRLPVSNKRVGALRRPDWKVASFSGSTVPEWRASGEINARAIVHSCSKFCTKTDAA